MDTPLNTSRAKQSIALILLLGLIGCEGYGLYLSYREIGFGMFRYFTILSNAFSLIAALCALFPLLWALSHRSGYFPVWVRGFRYFVTCCLTVTMIVVVAVLIPFEGMDSYQKYLFEGSMLYMHLVCPVLSLVLFCMFEVYPRLPAKVTLLSLLLPVVYGGVFIPLNILKLTVGPYPFLMVYEQPVWMSVTLCFTILGGSYLLGLFIWWLNKKAK